MERETVRGSWSRVLLLMMFACLSAVALTTSVEAFKPTAEFGHVGIVTDAVTPITRTASTGETLRFSARAISQIRDATAGVDELFSSRGEFSVPQAHCDDELLPECTQRLIAIKMTVISLAQARQGQEARAQLGRALHTLQDFYSHSNWVNSPGPANTTFNATLGTGLVPRLPLADATCVDDFFDKSLTGRGLTNITTGYFGSIEPPPNKCAHGVLLGAGIHKDSLGRPFFNQARARAVEGTRNFVNQILDSPGISGNDAAIRALMDAHGTLGFIIDDTGSMGPVINGVRTAVGQIVAAAQDPSTQPDDYLLETFNDPSIGTPFLTNDPAALLSAVNAIRVTGGGDCPELSQAGLLAGIAAARDGSKLYFFSDASAKDGSLAGNVIAAANAKDITINYILNGSCSPVDPAYIRGAQETGGQLFFLSSGEIARVFSLIEPSLSGDLQPMVLVNTRLTSESRSYQVPVDSTVRRITFSVSLDVPGAVRVVRPSGLDVLATDADAVVTNLSTGRIVTVNSPDRGNWQLHVTGSGDLSASVMGNSQLQFSNFGFVELRGRLEHEGLFPIDGQPVLGDSQLARARVLGSFTTVRFEAVSPAGVTLRGMTLEAGNPDAAADEYVGTVDLPLERFRVYARGTDANGFEFVRAFPATLGVQAVRVRPVAVGFQLPLGQTTPVQFEVTNLGPSATFVITAADEAGFLSDVTPSTLSLGPGAAGISTVSLTVPQATPLSFDTLTVVARNSTDPTVSNSARVGLAIGVPDRDNDGVPDDRDLCPDSNRSATIVIDNNDSGVQNNKLADGCYQLDLIGRVAAEARNHGDFVSGIAQLTNGWKRDGLITGNEHGAIQRSAARARIP